MDTVAEVVKSGGRKMTTLGVIAIILGILAIIAPVMTGAWVMFLLGVLVLAGGIVRIIWAFTSDNLGKGLLKFAIGVLTLLCGILILAHPILAMGILTIIIAIYLVLDGIAEIVAGFKRKFGYGGGWMVFAGIVSIILGIIIWRQFPLSGIWAVGVLLGIKLLFAGLIMLTVGSAAQSVAKT